MKLGHEHGLARHRWALVLVAVATLMGTISAPRPAAAATNAEVEVFLATLAPGAKDSWYHFGVPASVTLAQAALETGWGGSKLSKAPYNNYFGIKCNDNGFRSPYQNGCVAMETREYRSDGSSYVIVDEFRTYASPSMSMLDHGYYLKTRGLYDKAFQYNEDPKRFATEVRAGGYATDPSYATMLHTLMDQRKLFRFDWRTGVGAAPSPGAGGATTPALGGPVAADPLIRQQSPTDLAAGTGLDPVPAVTTAPATSSAPTPSTSAPASTAPSTPASSTPASTTPPLTTAPAAAPRPTEPARERHRPMALPATGA